MSRIRFATLNIGGGVPYNCTPESQDCMFNAVNYVSRLISDNDLDVVCFQEILMADDENKSMSSLIASECGLKFYRELMLSDSHIVKGRKMGVSIVSRFPINFSEAFMLENPHLTKIVKPGIIYKSHEKGFLISILQTDMSEICCVTGHCLPFHAFDQDVMAFKYIYKALEEKLIMLNDEMKNVIIGADFNTAKLNQLMPEVFRRYRSLVDMPTRPNGRRDDYIICDRNTEAEFHMIETCFDHFGCIAVYG